MADARCLLEPLYVPQLCGAFPTFPLCLSPEEWGCQRTSSQDAELGMWHMPLLLAVSRGCLLESNAFLRRRSRGSASFHVARASRVLSGPALDINPQPSDTCGSRLLPGMDGMEEGSCILFSEQCPSEHSAGQKRFMSHLNFSVCVCVCLLSPSCSPKGAPNMEFLVQTAAEDSLQIWSQCLKS